MNKILSLITAALLAATLAGCGSDDSGGGSGDKTLTVLAASSLTETFDQLAKEFESEHKGVKVKLVYDSSATLAGVRRAGRPR